MTSSQSIPLVRSALLSQFPKIVFGMSTRQGDESGSLFRFNLGYHRGDDPALVDRNLERFLSALELTSEEFASMEQEHGTTITEVDGAGVYPATDVLITRTCRLGLAIRVADCVPLALYSPASNIVAAIHAGWKGTAAHVAAHTVEYLRSSRGVDPASIFAYLGPAARSCCYEIQPDVAALFPESVLVKKTEDKVFLDLHEANLHQLLSAGLDRRNIEIEPLCTVCNPSFFHSHRRDGALSGRMLAVISMKEETN
jgi:polyphenol oxidase